MKRILIVSAIIVIAILSLTYWKYKEYVYQPIDSNDKTDISIQIKKNEPPREIASNLEEKGLIQNDSAFYIYMRLHGLDKNIIYGRFMLNKTMNVPQILQSISDPSKAEYIITIQEGLTIIDIDEKLVELNLTKPGDFIAAVKNFDGWRYYTFLNQAELKNLEYQLEGYLYPDTYFLDPEGFKASDLIYLTLDNFEEKFAEFQPQIKKHSINQIVTMASIIEKEVIGEKDKKLVSGILWKRLENDWKLDADSTILYTKDDRNVTKEDLLKDSPYNTRKIKGLPPGPICNPSIESIEAAMFPEESEYWFYLTKPLTGEAVYATTNEEQNQNKEKYL